MVLEVAGREVGPGAAALQLEAQVQVGGEAGFGAAARHLVDRPLLQLGRRPLPLPAHLCNRLRVLALLVFALDAREEHGLALVC
jgi:hypothetical protein